MTSPNTSPLLTTMLKFTGRRPEKKRRAKSECDSVSVLEFPPDLDLAGEEPPVEKKRKVRKTAIVKAAVAVSEGPRGFWSDTTDLTCPDYELKIEKKLDGFLPITAVEWLALPVGTHTKYSKKVWQGEVRKAVYAITGKVAEGKEGRQCSGYKTSGQGWAVTVYPDMLFYKSDGHKRVRSSFIAQPRQ